MPSYEDRIRQIVGATHIRLDNIIDNMENGIGDTESWEAATNDVILEFLNATGFKEIGAKFSKLVKFKTTHIPSDD